MFRFMLGHHSNGPGAHFRRKLVRRLACHRPYFSRVGVSGKLGAVQYGPSKTLYNRWKRWGDKGIFIQMMEGLAVPEAPERKTIMIDATYLKAHRTASSLRVKKGVRVA